jgi:DNA polymerase III subunit epsilon
MAILFFDTETMGFYDERSAPNDPCQPYIVQLAAQLCDDDGKDIAEFSFIVNPGIPIPKKTSDVHGITDDKAIKFGVSLSFAMMLFQHMYERADLVCTHNIKFDQAVIETAIARNY